MRHFANGPKTTIQLHFGQSGFVKMASFQPELEPKFGTALFTVHIKK